MHLSKTDSKPLEWITWCGYEDVSPLMFVNLEASSLGRMNYFADRNNLPPIIAEWRRQQ
jgi:hypothetical protein